MSPDAEIPPLSARSRLDGSNHLAVPSDDEKLSAGSGLGGLNVATTRGAEILETAGTSIDSVGPHLFSTCKIQMFDCLKTELKILNSTGDEKIIGGPE